MVELDEDILLSLLCGTSAGSVAVLAKSIDAAKLRQFLLHASETETISVILRGMDTPSVNSLLQEALTVQEGEFNFLLVSCIVQKEGWQGDAGVIDQIAKISVAQATDVSQLTSLIVTSQSSPLALSIAHHALASHSHNLSDKSVVSVIYECCRVVSDPSQSLSLVRQLLSSLHTISVLDVNVTFYSLINNTLLLTTEELLVNLSASDRHTRRLAKWLLTTSSVNYMQCAACSWELFWKVYDSADEYSSHLFKSSFESLSLLKFRSGNLTGAHPENADGCITAHHIAVLLDRCLGHENHHVVKFAISEICSNPALTDFVLSLGAQFDLSSFLSALEKTPNAFQNQRESDNISAFLRRVIVAIPLTKSVMLSHTMNTAKLYYPIIHCYLTAAAGAAASATPCSDSVYESACTFVSSRITAFPAVLRPGLVSMLAQAVPLASPLTNAQLCFIYTMHQSTLSSAQAKLSFPPSLVQEAGELTLNAIRSTHTHPSGSDESLSLPVLGGAAVAVKTDQKSLSQITEKLEVAIVDSRDRQYMPTDAKETLLCLLVLFRDHINADLLRSVLSSDVEGYPGVAAVLMESGVKLSETRRDTMVRTLESFLVRADMQTVTDDEIFTITWSIISLSLDHSYPQQSETMFNRLLALNLPRVSPDYTPPHPYSAISQSLLKFSNREEISDAFHSFKWRLLSRWAASTHVVASADLLDHLSTVSSQQLGRFNEFATVLLDRDLVSDPQEFVSQYCFVCFGFIAERDSDFNANGGCLDSTLRIALRPAGTEAEPAQLSFVKKLLKVNEANNPVVGRIALPLIIALVRRAASNPHSPSLVQLLVELVLHKEGFDEHTVEGAQFGVSQQPDGATADSLEATSAFIRVSVLTVLKQVANADLVDAVIGALLEQITQWQSEVVRKNAPQTPLPFTPFHRVQLRAYQALSYLSPLVSEQTFRTTLEPALFGPLLQWANQPDCRDYLESMAIYLMQKFQFPLNRLCEILSGNVSSQAVASFVVIGGFLASRPRSSSEGIRELIIALLPHLSSNVSYIRGVSQQWLVEADANGVLLRVGLKDDPVVSQMLSFILNNKESVQMRRKLSTVYTLWDPVKVVESGEILSLCSSGAILRNSELVPASIFINAVKEGVHAAMANNWFFTRDLQSLLPLPHALPAKSTTSAIRNESADAQSMSEEIGNAQRKYCPQIGSLFPGIDKSQSRRNTTELIVVTSLVDKVTNIAGLCRSAEVLGASTLVVPSLNVLKDAQFSSMSVTAEQWIDVIEIAPESLESYLQTTKAKGYTVVCLEQTHDSVQIDQYKFPSKTCLVLGNEKSGVPLECLPFMDTCVEIPQKGVIRSLNVHVSGAIAMWQYNLSQ